MVGAGELNVERLIHIRFAQPAYLLLLAAVPVIFWMARRSIAGLGKVRGRLAIAARILLVLAIAAALARAQFVRVRDDMAVAFVVDKSLSVPGEVQERALDQVARWQTGGERAANDRVALVTFGENAAIDQPFTTEEVDTVTSYAVVEPTHTDIAAALRAAMAAMPEAGRRRIVLISDGNETTGAAASEAASAKSAGVRIDCLPVRYDYHEEVMVEKLIAPAEVAPGKTINLRALVRAYNRTTGTLRISANGVPIASERVALEPGVNAFALERVLSESGVYDFEATIECDDDTMYQNNSASAFSVVRGPKKVLVVEGTEDEGRALADVLSLEKVSVDVVTPGILPAAVHILSRYDAIILANVAAFDMPEEKIRLLETAVKDYGIGLVMVGGADSFGAGGWRGTAVEDALPVTMDVKDRQVIPTGALVIINHTCEFPDGNRWGIDISKAALNTLGDYDEFGILYYGMGGEQWLINLQPVTNRAAMKRRIDRMAAGDMPSFDTTLNMAHAALKKSSASVKHVVIISDGDPTPPLPSFLQKIAADGITISTVVIFPHSGGPDVQKMQLIAKVCNGRFYYPRSAKQLPQIFIKEARTVRRGLIFEQPFAPEMTMTTVPVTGFSGGDFPILKGYVITTPKPLAEMPLVTNNADPLLAHWQYGLGRTVAFTSDATSKWAAEWMGWSGYGRFWGQVVEWAERKVQTGDFSTAVSVEGSTARISVDAIDKAGEYVNFLQFEGNILSPRGDIEKISLEQTAPGHYEGTFEANEVGTYVPLLKYTDAQGRPRMHMAPVTVPFSAEYRALSTNDVLLSEISEITGGKVISVDDNVFRRDFPALASYTDVWQWILAAGVVIFLADVFVRRVILDYAKIAAAVRNSLAGLPGLGRLRPAAARAPAYTSRLLKAKRTATAGRKFEAGEGGAEGDVEEVLSQQAAAQARRAAEKRAQAAPVSEVAAGGEEEEEETYTSRLLKAKRRARREDKDKYG